MKRVIFTVLIAGSLGAFAGSLSREFEQARDQAHLAPRYAELRKILREVNHLDDSQFTIEFNESQFWATSKEVICLYHPANEAHENGGVALPAIAESFECYPRVKRSGSCGI